MNHKAHIIAIAEAFGFKDVRAANPPSTLLSAVPPMPAHPKHRELVPEHEIRAAIDAAVKEEAAPLVQEMVRVASDNKNLHYCLIYLRNAGERIPAIRLAIDVLGLKFLDAVAYVDGLSGRVPCCANRETCWLCGKPGHLQEQVVRRVSPGGEVCHPKMVKVHHACWMDMEE